MLVFVVVCLTKVELHLEFGGLCDFLNGDYIDLTWVKGSVISSVRIEFLRVVKQLIHD